MNSYTASLAHSATYPESKSETFDAFEELEKSVYAALETYSNVHRGSGHFSVVTTRLYEQARKIVLGYLGLNRSYVVIFATPRSAAKMTAKLQPDCFQVVSPTDFGLSLGVRAVAIRKNALSKVLPFHVGGGNARLVSPDWIVWAQTPDKFEAGTPAILNVIALARALQMIQQYGDGIFKNSDTEIHSAAEILFHDELDRFSGSELLGKLRQTLIGGNIQVPTAKGMQPFLNFDNSASTPTFEPVWNAFRQAWRQPGQVKNEIIQEVKGICATTLGAPLSGYDVVFTSNTTEAINLAAESVSREAQEGDGLVVVGTLAEHSSNDLPWRMVPNSSMVRLTPDSEGFIDLKELETLLAAYNQNKLYGAKRIKLVAVNGASNVLGVCNDLEEISRIAHRYGVQLLVDAAQLVAHRKVDVEGWGIDYLAFSAHKVYAPFGCGALIVRKGLLRFTDEEQAQIQSSGEENTGGIAALGKALVLLQRIGMDFIQNEELALTARLMQGIAKIDAVQVYGMASPDSPRFTQKVGVVVFEVGKKLATNVGKELATQHGVGVRTGCHCAHIIVKHLLGVGPGLQRFQRVIVTLFPKLSLPGIVRVSLGLENTEAEVEALLQALIENAATQGVQATEQQLTKVEAKHQVEAFVHQRTVLVYG
jgi:selenocysteine lyase/cysteine desulfurase